MAVSTVRSRHQVFQKTGITSAVVRKDFGKHVTIENCVDSRCECVACFKYHQLIILNIVLANQY